MIKRIASLGLTAIMLLGSAVSVQAADISSSGGNGSSKVTVDVASRTFRVTVPSVLPIWVDSDNNVTVANNAKIRNLSEGPVDVTNVSVEADNGWSLVPFNTDFKKVPVDTKQYGMTMYGDDVVDGVDLSLFDRIDGSDEISVVYDGSVAIQQRDINKADIGHVVFTVAWANGPRLGVNDITYNVENSLVREYMAKPAYNSNDYSYTYMTLPSELSDTPGSGSLSVPEGAATITVTSSVDGKSFTDTVSGSTYEVKNLIPNVTYDYEIKDTANTVVKSGKIYPTGTRRMIKAEKGRNTRDLGGLTADNGTLKYGVLYRGAELDGKNYGDSFILTEADKAFYANFLGIKAELDLRSASESPQVASLNGVDYLCTNNLGAYGNFRQDNRIATAINFIADELSQNKPTYFHCMAGADRTATIACLIEAICGVPEDQIDRDYELTTLAKMNGNSTYTRNSSLWTGLRNAINMLNFSTFRDNAIASLINLGVSLETINSIRHSLIDGNPTDITLEYLTNGSTSVFDKTTAQVGTRVNSSGNVVTAESWSVTTAPIPCQKGDRFYIVSDRSMYVANRYAGATYDSNGTKLQSITLPDTTSAFYTVTDDNASSVRFTIPCNDINNITVLKRSQNG